MKNELNRMSLDENWEFNLWISPRLDATNWNDSVIFNKLRFLIKKIY